MAWEDTGSGPLLPGLRISTLVNAADMSGSSDSPRLSEGGSGVPRQNRCIAYMTTGRNDPCPCGSGKKYKKCCLGKEPQTSGPKMPDNVEARFYSPAMSYYTQAALAEALKPNGLVEIHPYVLIKLRGDPQMLRYALPEYRVRMLQMWRGSTVAAMSDQEIEDRLILMGAVYDRAEFVERTKTKQSAWEIAEDWGKGLLALSRADRDFFGLAACELWRRLCPERPSHEMIDDWVCEGYRLVEQKKSSDALNSWWKVWETIRARLTPDMKDLSRAGESLFPRMSQCLSNWSVDFRLEAVNFSLDDLRAGEIGIRFCGELIELLPDADHDLNVSGDLSMLYYHVGDTEQGDRCCQQLIEKRPDLPAGYAHLTDELVRRYSKGQADADLLHRAIQLLEQALAYPVQGAESWNLASRLANARKLLQT